MGLTARSTGKGAVDSGLNLHKQSQQDKVIALAGNPNVGKSTVFNALTGMNQHTGNWPGKTVSNAQGTCFFRKKNYIFVDLPGTYSILSHSEEEEVARDFLCFGGADAVVVVCDATCLERNLNLVLQVLEITPNVIVCVNLMDEAKSKKISIDVKKLSQELGVPVIGTSARHKKGLTELMEQVQQITDSTSKKDTQVPIRYLKALEEAIAMIEPCIEKELSTSNLNARWVAIRFLCGDEELIEAIEKKEKVSFLENEEVKNACLCAQEYLEACGISREQCSDRVVSCIVMAAEGIANDCVCYGDCACNKWDRKLDSVLISRKTGIPIMLLLLAVVFWLTITGANYPSELLSKGLFWVQDRLSDFFLWIGSPIWLHDMLVLGVYRVLAWVVSVMLPPMAIFFPLFTLLEDFGYLPRVAFNLDHHFKKAGACGKQALTMCMGFGCNAAGIVGCRIIDSPRERLIAMLTNNFVPCNGRFPTLITIISLFFLGGAVGLGKTFLSAIFLVGVILLGVLLTFWVSRLLSKTVLKGVPSSFTLELPPYRKPQVGKVIVRSLMDRTVFVLGRAVAVAIPAGLIIWLFANIQIGDMSLLSHCAEFLDPFGRLLGMDGVILFAFILGFPANEIVVPIMLMAYMSTGSLVETGDLSVMKTLLLDNGWTWITAVSTMLFCLIHWPCSTTCWTIKKESGSLKWTAISILLPTVIGLAVCFLFTTCARLVTGLI